ncbi:MAG: CDP-diacylglycerol--serine O-phosphatidyltransferase [Kiritimatiellae bacterium]|nr:CDP-diacylglycerol--serine O-phosphatidyltransferase [Kiritimatiellia bacterium]
MGKFRFRRRKQRQRVQREIPIRAIIPNLVTMMAAASGVTSIRFSCAGEWKKAAVFILLACMFDGLDGRVARMLRATSKLGAELDSLSDFVSFGVAPAILVYFWIMKVAEVGSTAYQFRGCFWALALFYAMCCAFRLARFNIMLEMPTQPYWKHFFMGLPAPGGAGLVILPIVWQMHEEGTVLHNPWVGSVCLFLCGLLMASRCPTLSLKHLAIPPKWLLLVLLVAIFTLGMLISQFWVTLTFIGVMYYISIPICGAVFCRLRARDTAQDKAGDAK